jgi:signal transduction histidine kinase
MKKKELLKIYLSILFISCIYFGLFAVFFSILHSPAIALISIVFVSYVSWKRGAVAGLVLSTLNFLWNSVAFTFITSGLAISKEAFISIGVHIGVSFLLGYFGRLARNLRMEVEERKKAEALLITYQNELEERVEARTSELEKAREKLHQAEKMEAIGQLAGGIAHDFNNYLNIIIGCSGLLSEKIAASAQSLDLARKIEQSAKMASELTSQLLTFARKKKFELKPIDLADLVGKLIPLLSRGVKKEITIIHNAEAQLPAILADAAQIQTALLNLGLNANDAMENGGTLTFTTKAIKVTPDFCSATGIGCNPGDYVGVAVSDTGCGIQPEVLSHLFEPFFTTKAEGKGTGLGLATVYGIAQGHKGDVFVETQHGKGSTFTMLFPTM